MVGRDVIVPPPAHRKLGLTSAERLFTQFSKHICLENIGADLGRQMVSDARSALEKLAQDANKASLGLGEKMALEAIVIADGIRPVVNFSGPHLVSSGVDLGEWKDVTNANATTIETVAQSVGRINLNGQQIGTGFVVTDTDIMTNRHVLEKIGEQVNGAWNIHEGVTISFSDDGQNVCATLKQNGTRTDNVKAVTGQDFRPLDYAIIPVDPTGSGSKLPNPLGLEETRSYVMSNREVYVLGYPGRPQPGTERFSVLKAMFQSEYGIKRFCPGYISASFDDIHADSNNTIFGHDCTTLGGNSGSPVIDLGDNSASVVGLHFGGDRQVSNYAHSMAALRNEFENERLIFI